MKYLREAAAAILLVVGWGIFHGGSLLGTAVHADASWKLSTLGAAISTSGLFLSLASYFIVRDLPSRSRLATWIFVPIFWGFYLAVMAFIGAFLSDTFEFPVFSYGVYIVALSASACVGFRRIVLKGSK